MIIIQGLNYSSIAIANRNIDNPKVVFAGHQNWLGLFLSKRLAGAKPTCPPARTMRIEKELKVKG